MRRFVPSPKASSRRRLVGERLEPRWLAAGWQNPRDACDVDDSGFVSPLDALVVIGDLSRNGSRDLPPDAPAGSAFPDVDGNGTLAPADALAVINLLNEPNPPIAVALSLAPESDPNGNGVVLLPSIAVTGQTLPRAAVSLSVSASPSVLQTTADDAGRFRFALDLGEVGAKSLHVVATDRRGRTAEAERTVRYGDAILDWNASLLNVIRDWTTLSNDPYENRIVPERPPVAARNLAMVHVAMYDAAIAVERTHPPFRVDLPAPVGASSLAAAAAAAHRVATHVYREPDELAVWDAALTESLAIVPDGPGETLGVDFGRQVGDALLAWRANDGATAAVPYVPGHDPGDWNRTFPDFLPPLLPQWPRVAPFAMPSPDAFRPPPPPELTSAEYAAAVEEVRRLGGLDSTERTAEQTEIALFWADGGGTFTPPGHWNQIAADVALARRTSPAENARLMALLNVALADAGIAAWDAKYAYALWRPIDALRRADQDGHDATVPAPGWTPLLKTPPFPTYTSGHSTFSGAASTILAAFFGDDLTFTTEADGHNGFTQRPLAEQQVRRRSFASFSAAAEEAGLSRIFGGIHFSFDNTAGLAAGRAIGRHVLGD